MSRDLGLSPDALKALLEAAAAINASLDLQRTLQTIAESAARVMDAEASSVLLLDRARGKLVFQAACGEHGQALIGEEFDASLGIAGEVVATGRPKLIADVASEGHHFRGIDEKHRFLTRNMIAAPLRHQDEVLGVVEVINRRGGRQFEPGQLPIVEIFANLAAIGCRNAQSHARLERENRNLRVSLEQPTEIIGESGALKRVLELARRVAGSHATVLLLGESGTGKELLARTIHRLSPRADHPFVAINCAALPESLLESELFGHEKGAFTGATAQKIGRFEVAEGGTLFLDEIGELHPSIQVKLLRVLQEKEIVRVGGTRTLSIDVRIIAATNRDLKQAVARGEFREDLYYRLNVFPIHLPPLRERREDIPPLVEHIIARAARELGVRTPRVPDDVMAVLTSYDWPGNIRELQNVLERAVLLCDSEVLTLEVLPPEIAGHAAVGADGDARPVPGGLRDYERAMIIKALKDHNWNQTQAARALGISRDNLRYRVKKYGIRRPDRT